MVLSVSAVLSASIDTWFSLDNMVVVHQLFRNFYMILLTTKERFLFNLDFVARTILEKGTKNGYR